jgi:DNA-binding MarR family transcriptional regulator
MNGSMPVSDEVDALGLAGGLLYFLRILDQQVRLSRREDGLSLAEISVLGAVAAGHDTPSSVARALRLDPARITHISDRLVSLGYLRREIDQVDRRRWRMSLTSAGETRAHEGRSDVDCAMRRLLVGLTQSEVDGMINALEGIQRVVGDQERS